MEACLQIQTESDMLALGERIGAALRHGGFVALYGDLGAGKTVLARGVGRALGVERLTSPTFTIVQEYPTVPKLYHFDAYRLADEDELYAIGFADYCSEEALILMEWANLVPACLPRERLDVQISGSAEEPRTVRITAHGAAYEALLHEDLGL